jgi:beta-N-acetylhexosaminidase
MPKFRRRTVRATLVIITALVLWTHPDFSLGGALTTDQRFWVERTLARMTLDEKIGQTLFPVASGVFTSRDSDEFQRIKENIETYHVGGYHIEGDGGDPATAALLIERIQQLAKIPLLITADLEGGAGYQFRGATRFPRGMAIGATGNTQYAYEAGRLTALEAKAMGININFYPVVDVNNNPQNPIINIRSFGENPQKVGEFGVAYIKGTQDAGLLATAKHFPGHGDTSVNSHLHLPVLNFDRARLDKVELPSFEAAIQAGVSGVMTAHIALPQMEKSADLPASLSPELTTGLLRKDLGFQGLVFTDALVMHAISMNFGAERAPVLAIEAGADVALEPADLPKAFAALKDAVVKGEITEARLNESVRRLLEAKARAGLMNRQGPDLAKLDEQVGTRATAAKAQEIIEHALTLVKDDRNTIPLKLPGSEQVLLLNVVDADNPEYAGNSGATFRAQFLRRHPKTFTAQVTPGITRQEADLIEQLAAAYRTVVISCFIRIASYKGFFGLTDAQQALLRAVVQSNLAKPDGQLAFALFGSPYLLDSIPELPTYALAYEFYPDAEAAMVRALFGEIKFQGKLPVTVANYPAGTGLGR